MSTATEEPVTVISHNHQIPLPENFEDAAEPGILLQLETLSRRQEQHDSSVDAWREAVSKLIDDAMTSKTRELDEGGALQKRATKLREEHADLETSACTIGWERFELRPRLVPSFRNTVTMRRENYERVLGDEMKRLVEFGIYDALPAARHNPEAAQHQLRHRADQEEYVMAAAAVRNRAEQALEQLEQQMDLPPRPAACKIAYPTFAGFSGKIAAMLGLDGSVAAAQPRPSFIDRLVAAITGNPQEKAAHNFTRLKCQAILRDMGLDNAAITPRHEAIIEELSSLIDSDHSHPLSIVNDVERAHKLIAELPPTPQQRAWVGSPIAIVDHQ